MDIEGGEEDISQVPDASASGGEPPASAENKSASSDPSGAGQVVDPKQAEIESFDELLLDIKDPDLARAGSLYTLREKLSTLDKQISEASDGDQKDALQKQRAEEDKKYQAELAEFGPELDKRIRVIDSEINYLCKKLNPPQDPTQVQAIDQSKLDKDESAKVDEIRKKQAESEKLKKLQAQLANAPPPAATPQLPAKLKQAGVKSSGGLGTEVGDKTRPDLNQTGEQGMFEQLHSSVLLNMILFLLSKKSPTRYIIAVAALGIAKATGVPVQIARKGFCAFNEQLAKQRGDDLAAERWAKAGQGIDVLNAVDIRANMSHMLGKEQADSLLARKLFEEFCLRPGITNDTKRQEAVAPVNAPLPSSSSPSVIPTQMPTPTPSSSFQNEQTEPSAQFGSTGQPQPTSANSSAVLSEALTASRENALNPPDGNPPGLSQRAGAGGTTLSNKPAAGMQPQKKQEETMRPTPKAIAEAAAARGAEIQKANAAKKGQLKH